MIETDKYKIYNRNNKLYLLLKDKGISVPIDTLLMSLVDTFYEVVTETEIASIYEYQD